MIEIPTKNKAAYAPLNDFTRVLGQFMTKFVP